MRATLVSMSLLVLGGCPGSIIGGLDDDDQTDPNAQLEQDTAEYQARCAALEARRTRFAGEVVDEMFAEGNQVYFLEYPGFDPTLHRYDNTADKRLNYAFSIGRGDQWNFRASSDVVVTAERDGDQVHYRSWNANRENELLSQVSVAAPQGGVRWWAYAVSGSTVWIVSGDTLALRRWDATTGGQPEFHVALLSATNSQLGEFLDFDVDGNTMVFIEGGRIWSMDLTTRVAQWLHNETEVTGAVDFQPDGVMFAAADGVKYFNYSARTLVDFSARIRDSGYRFNESYATIHYFGEGFARWRQWVVYGGASGIFAYHLDNTTLVPVLLEPRDSTMRVVYRHPVVLEDGTLFINGLESMSGSVGADGPIYKVPLSTLLP